MFGEWTETDRQTVALNCEISTVWETEPRTTPRKTPRLLMVPEQVTGPKPYKLYDDDDDGGGGGDDDEIARRSKTSGPFAF